MRASSASLLIAVTTLFLAPVSTSLGGPYYGSCMPPYYVYYQPWPYWYNPVEYVYPVQQALAPRIKTMPRASDPTPTEPAKRDEIAKPAELPKMIETTEPPKSLEPARSIEPKKTTESKKLGPIIMETRLSKSDASATKQADKGRYRVGFWNVTGRDITLTIDGEERILPRDRAITLELARNFAWHIDRDRDKNERIPEGQNSYEVIIRP